jgi:hypothetical protein
MKIIRLYALLVLIFLFSCSVAAAQQEKVKGDLQQVKELGALFEDPEHFQELDMDIKIVRTKKMKFSIKDLPFYTKIFCSYVYEEKIKKGYQSAIGYLFASKGKVKTDIN